MNTLYKILALAVLSLPYTASAAPQSLKELANILLNVIEKATSMLVLATFLFFFLAIALSLFKSGDAARKRMRENMLWGILALFVLVSIWGILHLLRTTLFGAS